MSVEMSEERELQPSVLLPLSAAEVFDRYADMVYRIAFTRTKSRADADDLLQEVFVRYIQSDPQFSVEEHRKAWLISVTLHCSTNLALSAWNRRTTPLDEVTRDTSSAFEPDHSDVYEAVMSLPAKYRTAIHLFYYEDYSVTEIALLCGLPEATVKTHLFRARERLRKNLAIETNKKGDRVPHWCGNELLEAPEIKK
ncbi:MAG: sigma-70 family RNA polymerase sigma factor [Oscillospiraceae bacterium]|nr:sigma-70 family RNA polymerase sigma factor [Oscillospiraceae bacterium]